MTKPRIPTREELAKYSPFEIDNLRNLILSTVRAYLEEAEGIARLIEEANAKQWEDEGSLLSRDAMKAAELIGDEIRLISEALR